MTYIVTEACIGVKDKACIAVCPVDAFEGHEDDSQTMVFINPHDCIECGACVLECPVEAIFKLEEVPAGSRGAIAKNFQFFGLQPPNV